MMIHRNLKQREARHASLIESAQMAKQEDKIPYTKTDINRMSKDELVTLAVEIGILGAEEMTGADIKKSLIEKFGL